jgi:hypothetical protein
MHARICSVTIVLIAGLMGIVGLFITPAPLQATPGSGPALVFPQAMAIEPSGAMAVVANGLIMRVNPHSGDRTIVSGGGMGSGPTIGSPQGIAVEASGGLVVTSWESAGNAAVVRVDPGTGARTVISGCTALEDGQRIGAIIGDGFPLSQPGALAVEAMGDPGDRGWRGGDFTH